MNKQTLLEKLTDQIRDAFNNDKTEVERREIADLACTLKVVNCRKHEDCSECILYTGETLSEYLDENPGEWQ